MKVLVAIPTLFVRDALRKELESLENQSLRPYKILLITPRGSIGGDWEEFLSKFKSVELAYLENYTREEVVSKKRNSMIDARNYALSRAETELEEDDIVIFLDDDCILDKNWILVAVQNLENEEVGGFTGKVINHRDEGTLRKAEVAGLGLIQYLFGSDKIGSITECGYVSTAFDGPSRTEVDHLPGVTMAYKAGKVRGLKFDENYKGNCYREETDFSLRVKKNFKLIYDPEAKADHILGTTRRDRNSTYYKSYNHIYFWKKNFDFTFCFFIRESLEALLLIVAALVSFNADYLYGIKGKIDSYRKFLFRGNK
ncbi:MAG: glycosyltransferase family 2 protein [Thermodesulfobacteriota bacterium]